MAALSFAALRRQSGPLASAAVPASGALALMAVGVTLLFGLSGFLDGFYLLSVWGPVTLLLAALLVAAVVAAPVEIGRLGLVALGGLVLALVWTAASWLWAESLDRAWTEFGRLGLYAITLTICLTSIRSARVARALVQITGLAVAAAAIYVLARCLAGTGSQLFQNHRLFEPMGYFNGEAAYFGLGFWALFGLAEGESRPAVQGIALALATALAEVAVLAQSRGAAIGFVAAAAVVLACFPGRLERAWRLAIVVAAGAVALPWLLDVYAQRLSAAGADSPSESVLRAAAMATLVSSVAAGLVWAAAVRVGRRLGRPLVVRQIMAGLLAVVVLAASGAVLARIGDPVERLRAGYRDFVSLAPETGKVQRFTSANTSRYHQWQIAIDAFESAPLKGVGAGNYATFYVQRRRIREYVTQPHSLTFQALSEVGLIGAFGFLIFAGAVLWAAFRPAPGGVGRSDLCLTVPCTGMFVMWLVHTNVDWLHRLPGVTGIALVAAAVLLTRGRTPSASLQRPSGRGPALAAVLGALVVAAGAGVLWSADRYREDARAALVLDPSAALEHTDRSIGLNPERVDTYIVKAAAYARLGDYRSARAALRIGTAKEPHNYVPWALLGDLAVRRGLLDQARRAYRRANALNPRDRSLARLAKNPQRSVGQDGS